MNNKKKQAKLRSIGFNGKCKCGSNKIITLHHKFPKRKGNQRLQTTLPRSLRYEALCQRCHRKLEKALLEKELKK